MPRRLLRDRRIVEDEWRYAAGAVVGGVVGTAVGATVGAAVETTIGAAAGAAAGGAVGGAAGAKVGAGVDASVPLIVSLAQWHSDRDALLARGGRLGVTLLPADPVEALAADIAHLSLIASQFGNPSEGRGYSHARLLRERWHFAGELRAAGYVRRDQLFFLARCGFNSFELPDADLEGAAAAFATFSLAYQPSNDAGLAVKLRSGRPASA
jgi:uncharacterized protein (DUF934 family)